MIRVSQIIFFLTIVLTTLFINVPASAEQQEPQMPSSTTLYETSDFAAIRQGKHFIIELKESHQVLSTSDINGGQTSSLKYIVNFQSVEGNAHNSRFDEILSLSNQQYHQQLADGLQLDSQLMAIRYRFKKSISKRWNLSRNKIRKAAEE